DMDLYALLGLAPGASPADIKRAFRRLSRRYHPDINPGDRAAEALFRKISEAYETLVDPDPRRTYDEGGSRPEQGGATFEFTGFDFSAGAHGTQASTFTELFAEVLYTIGEPRRRGPSPDWAARQRPSRAGRRHSRDHLRPLRRLDARRRTPDRGDAAGGVRRVPRRRIDSHAGRALRAVPRRRQGAVGARPHGVHQELRRVQGH